MPVTGCCGQLLITISRCQVPRLFPQPRRYVLPRTPTAVRVPGHTHTRTLPVATRFSPDVPHVLPPTHVAGSATRCYHQLRTTHIARSHVATHIWITGRLLPWFG